MTSVLHTARISNVESVECGDRVRWKDGKLFFELGRRIKEDVHFICYERSVGQRKHLSPPLGFEPQYPSV